VVKQVITESATDEHKAPEVPNSQAIYNSIY